jgi:hypothetical protein
MAKFILCGKKLNKERECTVTYEHETSLYVETKVYKENT